MIIATLFTVTVARPQYNYPTPSQFPGGSYGTPGIGGGISVGNIGGISGGNIRGSGIGGTIGEGIPRGNIGGSGIGGAIIGNNGGGINGEGTNNRGISGGGGEGVLIQKHIYVHVAPPEPEEFTSQKQISERQATKHYKIIFIKAPSALAPTAPSIQLGGQNQEKTLIYVLVKRPEYAADITIPTAAPTQPSKPEVYFIRYKAKNEAVGGASNVGISGSSTGGSGTAGILTGGTGGSSNIGTSKLGSDGSSSTAIRPSTQYGQPGQSGAY